MSGSSVLVVCVGNLCRSPFAELLLAHRAPGLSVSSAGLAAVVGEPMEPEAARELAERGVSADGFRARQLTSAMVEEADLVLTATKAIRGGVLEESPGALRRTFTLRELAALLDVVEPQDDLDALVRLCAQQRSRAVLQDYDVPDPIGAGPAVHARAAALIDDAVARIAPGLDRTTGGVA